MKKLLILPFVICLAITGCQLAKRTTEIKSDVRGLVYNSLASKYMPRLTTKSLIEYSDGSEYLFYRIESYKSSYGAHEQIVFAIPFDNIDDHKLLLEKFLDWNDKALSRGDMLTKEIGRAKTYNGYSNYTFHSGNENSNYLDICFSIVDGFSCAGGDGAVFDVDNVKRILIDIDKFKNREITYLDDSVYE